jgi:hydrogenase maturation protease
MKTIVLGLGNTLLRDDGVGICIVEKLRGEVKRPGVDMREEAVAGLGIIDLIRGYDKLILVDAIKTENGRVGSIYKLCLDDLPTLHFSTQHDVSIPTALELGREIGEDMPKEIVIYAIEVENTTEFGSMFTPAVENAIPEAIELIKGELGV